MNMHCTHLRSKSLSNNFIDDHRIIHNKTIALSSDGTKQDLLKLHCIENRTFRLSLTLSHTITNIIMDDSGNDKENRSLSSPRTTIDRTPTQPLMSLSYSLPPRQQEGQLQKNDKIPCFKNQDLSPVWFPSLSSFDKIESNTCNQNERRAAKRDLSQLPLPRHIRLQPRRRKLR